MTRVIPHQLAKSYQIEGIQQLMFLIQQCVEDGVASIIVLTIRTSQRELTSRCSSICSWSKRQQRIRYRHRKGHEGESVDRKAIAKK